MKFSLLISAAAAMVIYAPNPLKSCGSSKDSFSLDLLDLDPYPVMKGRNITVKAAGTLLKDITAGASVALSVKAGFVPLYSTTVDLCDAVKKQGMECPITKGPHSVGTSQAIPDQVPSGTFNIKIVATNADKSPIACFQGDVVIQNSKTDIVL